MKEVLIIRKPDVIQKCTYRDKLAQLRRQGFWYGIPPQGYIYGVGDDGNRVLVRDPERFVFLRTMLKAIIYQTMSFGQIVHRFDDEYMTPKHGNKGGVKIKSWYAIRRMLVNPVYAGLVQDVDNPNTYRIGKHEPMITVDEWKILLERLGMNNEYTITNGKTA